MADRLERLTNLVALLLTTPQPLTLGQIADELGEYRGGDGARMAFERDKRLLRDSGVPLETIHVASATGGLATYRIDPRAYAVSGLDLTDDERVALHLAVAAMGLFGSGGREALWKLGGVLGDQPTALADIEALPATDELYDGIRRRAEVTFGYRGRPRTLQPYSLLFRNGTWYVIGHDVGYGTVRSYRVDRIEGEVGVGSAAAFERPEGFDPKSTLTTDPKLLGEDPLEVARVWVDAVAAPSVEAELGAAAVVERHADGSIEVEVRLVNRDAFRTWVLGLLDRAEVLGPPSLRADLVTWLADLAGV